MSQMYLENLPKSEIYALLEQGIFCNGESAVAKDGDGYIYFPDAKGDDYDGLGRDWVDDFKKGSHEAPQWRYIPNSEADGLAIRRFRSKK